MPYFSTPSLFLHGPSLRVLYLGLSVALILKQPQIPFLNHIVPRLEWPSSYPPLVIISVYQAKLLLGYAI